MPTGLWGVIPLPDLAVVPELTKVAGLVNALIVTDMLAHYGRYRQHRYHGHRLCMAYIVFIAYATARDRLIKIK
jgi:hypothetical protein